MSKVAWQLNPQLKRLVNDMLSMNKFIRVCIFALILVLGLPSTITYGALARPKSNEIPVKSLIVGTYIIDFKAVSPAHVETAQKTVANSGQDQIYYRSELTTGGIWFNITNGSGVGDIIESSENAVKNSDIDLLPLTHWIKNDGIVYELGTGNAKLFSTLNPISDPLTYDAMQPLGTERDKQGKILENLDDEDDGYGVAKTKKALLEGVLAAMNYGKFVEMDKAVDALDLASAKLRQDKTIEDGVIHAVDDQLTDLTIKRELFYLNALIAKLENAGEKAGTYDFGTLSDQIWTAHGKLSDIVRELEAEIGTAEATTPLEEAAEKAAEKLQQAALSGDLNAITEAAEEKSLTDMLALGLPATTPEGIEVLEEALNQAQNDAVIAALKGTSFDYDKAKAMGESLKVLDAMLQEETDATQEKLDNWKDILDMLLDSTDLDADKNALLEKYTEVLTSTLGALPESDMKPKLLEKIGDALADGQEALAVSAAGSNAVTQAALDSREQIENQLAVMNEAFADALENGDLEGAQKISALSESLLAQLDAEEEAALDAYLEALKAVDQAQAIVDAILAGQALSAAEAEQLTGAQSQIGTESGGSGTAGETSGDQTSGETSTSTSGSQATGTQTSDDTTADGSASGSDASDSASGQDQASGSATGQAGGSDASGADMSGEEMGTEGEDGLIAYSPVTLSAGIALLAEARNALEAIKGVLSPEDLMLMENFSALVDAVDVFIDEDNGTLAVSSIEALSALIPVLPDGFDGTAALSDLIEKMNLAKAQSAASGDLETAQAFAEGQMQLEEAKEDMTDAVQEALAAFESASGAVSDSASGSGTESSTGSASGAADKTLPISDTSVLDVLTGTLIIHVDSFIDGGTTYVGIKSLFDQIGGQAVWIPNQARALGIANGKTLSAKIGFSTADIDGEKLVLESQTQLRSGRAYVPFNTISEHIGQFLDKRYDAMRVIIVPQLMEE